MTNTVVIADDHAFTVEGMKNALENFGDFEVVATAENGVEAVSLVKKFQPDCALLDLSMPGLNGLEAFVEARRWSPETRFAIITGIIVKGQFRELIDGGIAGIFLKNMAVDEICAGLKEICEGKKKIADEVLDLIDGEVGSQNLTAREIQVLQSIARGMTNAKIAESLKVSPKTIDSHRTSLMRKMGVHTTATLLVRAMRDGLIDV